MKNYRYYRFLYFIDILCPFKSNLNITTDKELVYYHLRKYKEIFLSFLCTNCSRTTLFSGIVFVRFHDGASPRSLELHLVDSPPLL
jgi:hypothetical protein